jgi:hypothetical protein
MNQLVFCRRTNLKITYTSNKMAKNILSLALLILSAGLNFKHGWDAFQRVGGEQAKIMADLGLTPSIMPYIGVLSIAVGFLMIIPQTFFTGNLLSAFTILLIMALSLKAGNYQMALLEIPFLLMPLLLIWLKYPFKQ